MPSRPQPPLPSPAPVLPDFSQLSISQPSTTLPPPPAPPLHHHRHNTTSRILPPLAGVTVAASFFLVFFFRRLFSRRRDHIPSSSRDPNLPRRFSYSSLRRATSSFSPSRRIGQGGFGAVFSGTLTVTITTTDDKKNQRKQKRDVAVKLMDSGSLQGEREFHNEILMAEKLVDSDRVVRLLGFASDRKRRRMCLVYELMTNGNLQEGLLRREEGDRRREQELSIWSRRLRIAIEVAEAIAYLHHRCDPPIIHGDIKPSNVLLDEKFSAKVGDFGLSQLKLVSNRDRGGEDAILNLKVGNQREESRINLYCGGEDNGSVVETESVTTIGFEDSSTGIDQSPENFIRAPMADTSPEMFTAATSPAEGFRVEGGGLNGVTVEDHGEVVVVKSEKGANFSGKDWWFQQGNIDVHGTPPDGRRKVKDYVMEWIGTEVGKERMPNAASCSSSATTKKQVRQNKKKKSKKMSEWWVSMEEEKSSKEKRKPVREWWKEEYCEELAKKQKMKKKKKKHQEIVTDDGNNEENWWPGDDGKYPTDKKTKSRSRRSSRSSLDWWLDGFSGDLWKVRHNTSYDSVNGEIPKSGGISSTPSMRGTVCYIAPEYSGGADLSEKCDVYSYGVLLLVLVAGRRPLQVSCSPASEYQSANLITWARRLARCGKVLDLVDKKMVSLNREEAQLCITVALLCLQKSPSRRPSMKEVVGMLTGELDPPHLPVELSPSPPSSRYPYKSHQKKTW